MANIKSFENIFTRLVCCLMLIMLSACTAAFKSIESPVQSEEFPVLISATLPADGSYAVDDSLEFTLNFSEDVVVLGVPQIALLIGTNVLYATYVAGSGSDQLVFRYVVGVAPALSDAVQITDLDLNDGSIRDLDGNDADLSYSPAVTYNLFVDNQLPNIVNIVVPSPGLYAHGEVLQFELEFSETINVSGNPRLAVITSGSTIYADYVSTAGTTLTFRHTLDDEHDASYNIDLDGSIDLNGAQLSDAAGNSAALSFTSPDLSEVRLCPPNYIKVPSLAPYTADDFCVAKYHMKNVGGVATSRADILPWVSITLDDMENHCSVLGSGYANVSNDQYQSIVRDIAGVAENWSGGVAYLGVLNQGHSDGSPANILAASTDDDPCYGTDNLNCTDGGNADWSQKRTHRLSNNHVIWDMGGNATHTMRDFPRTDIAQTYASQANGEAQDYFGNDQTCDAPAVSPYCGMGLIGPIAYSVSRILIRGSYYAPADINTRGLFYVDTEPDNSMHDSMSFRCVWVPNNGE